MQDECAVTIYCTVYCTVPLCKGMRAVRDMRTVAYSTCVVTGRWVMEEWMELDGRDGMERVKMFCFVMMFGGIFWIE